MFSPILRCRVLARRVFAGPDRAGAGAVPDALFHERLVAEHQDALGYTLDAARAAGRGLGAVGAEAEGASQDAAGPAAGQVERRRALTGVLESDLPRFGATDADRTPLRWPRAPPGAGASRRRRRMARRMIAPITATASGSMVSPVGMHSHSLEQSFGDR